ncbi:ankyrin repeat-containing domain protein [Lyophyllum atratum]|nr:ankyrin repeat-containing domain protein [Lyophyllum atratum]
MAEKDATARLRRAVKENNLFLVRRLVQRTEMRNPDSSPRRYTSLAWAAVLGHEETFEFLLTAGHDDEELSRDSENNTILMLLADHKPPPSNPYVSQQSSQDISGATLRMARLYYDRYSWVLDWANGQGKTALHISAVKGNEELVRMFCDLGADVDLPDNKGNTPLHYASSWGHISVVQLLIERGCQFAARNNEGDTASDYAYSFNTKETLQDTARLTFENNKKSRRNQAVERSNEWGGSNPIPMPPPNVPPKNRDAMRRMRSGSGTSRSTNTTSDSGDMDSNGLAPGHHSQTSFSASSSPSHPSTGSNSYYHNQHLGGHLTPQMTATGSTVTVSGASPAAQHGSTLNPPVNPVSALSPIANRMRERDADAREKYLLRNRSGSQGTSSTDNRSQNGSHFASAGPSANGDDITALNQVPNSGASTPRRLRPSVSAAQLRTIDSPSPAPANNHTVHTQPENRNRSGTNPSTRPSQTTPLLTRSSSITTSPRSLASPDLEDNESYIGPPSQFAQFPEPPSASEDTTTPMASRRKAFHILSKPLPPIEQPASASHRRGMSAASVRGT